MFYCVYDTVLLHNVDFTQGFMTLFCWWCFVLLLLLNCLLLFLMLLLAEERSHRMLNRFISLCNYGDSSCFYWYFGKFFFVTRPWAGLDVSVVSWCSLGGYNWRFSQRSASRLHRSARIWYLLKYNYHNFRCFIPNFLPWSGLNLARMASVLMNSFFLRKWFTWCLVEMEGTVPQLTFLRSCSFFVTVIEHHRHPLLKKNVKLVTQGSDWPALIQKRYISNAGP